MNGQSNHRENHREILLDLTDLNFAAEALSGGPVPVLVDFTSVTCPPCRAIAPHLEAIAHAYAGRLRVAKCDVDGSPALAAALGIRALPTLLLFKEGRVIGQIVGAVPRAKIEALVAPHLAAAA